MMGEEDYQLLLLLTSKNNLSLFRSFNEIFKRDMYLARKDVHVSRKATLRLSQNILDFGLRESCSIPTLPGRKFYRISYKHMALQVIPLAFWPSVVERLDHITI